MAVPRGTLNQERWNDVLEAAAATFVEKGYRGTRMEDVADRLGILKGSLYYYVTSKRDLLHELIRRVNDSGLAVTAELRAMEGDAPTKLRAFIERWVTHVERHHHVALLFQNEIQHLGPEPLARVKRERSEMERAVRRVIEQGIAEGSFAADTDAETVTKALFLVLNTSHAWGRRRSVAARAAMHEQLAHLFLDGLLAR